MQLFRTIAPFVLTILILSCGSQPAEKSETPAASEEATSEPAGSPEKTNASGSFDLSKIPVSDKPLGDFPFFSVPEGLAIQNGKGKEFRFTRFFFPIDGIMIPVEGRAWMGAIVQATDNKEEWSDLYFEKSYNDAIVAAGGQKIFEGKIKKEEVDRIKDQATYFGEPGSIDYWNYPVKVYLIRRPDSADVYIQLYSNGVFAALQVLQKAAFKQTITLLKSTEIKKQLDEKGKVVLYIGFDTDKSSLTASGMEAVKEIAGALQSDKNLKVAINGYTDNSGTADHNKTLSIARAESVKAELIKSSIDASRLDAKGFGQDNPIAANDSEEAKAKNRRVELIKL